MKSDDLKSANFDGKRNHLIKLWPRITQNINNYTTLYKKTEARGAIYE
jgi:hypothetical protein